MDTPDKHPLRPYYKPREEVPFVMTAPPKGSGASASGANASAASGSSPSLSLPPRQANRYMTSDGDASLMLTSDKSKPGMFLRSVAVGAALQFSSTCLAMPFEVGKLLLQVQWVPREDVWRRMHVPIPRPRRTRSQLAEIDDGDDPWADSGKGDADWDDDDASHYFRDPSGKGGERPPPRKPRRTDSSGYVIPDDAYDNDARSEFTMPVVVKGGVWEMMKAVARGKEGWLGLWKGTWTTFLLDSATSLLQPVITSVMSLFAPKALSPVPIAFSPFPLRTLTLMVASHLITGVILSPLDLIRTRLVAQSTLPKHRKYSGPLDALRKIIREEGGWRTTYLAPTLLVPTLIDCFFRPLLSLMAPLVIENTLRLDPAAGPISYALAELALSTLALGVTLPLETVRRRLQLQFHEPLRARRPGTLTPLPSSASTAHKGLRTCVEARPVAYTGVTEAIYRIITEETSVVPQTKRAAEEDQDPDMSMGLPGTLAESGHSSLGGLRSLYRGFGMACSANLLVFVLTLVTGEREGAAGWAEL